MPGTEGQMNVNLFRKIDYWIGVPLCFLFSFLYQIKIFFTGKTDTENNPANPANIHQAVFLQISEMGSAVSAYPSLSYFKKMHPDLRVYYVIFDNLREIIDILGLVAKEDVLTIRTDGLFNFVKDTMAAIVKLRKAGVDCVVDLELFSRFTAVLGFLIGAPLRSGFSRFKMEGLYRGNFLTHPVIYNCYHHISHNFFSLVKAFESGHDGIPFSKINISAPLPGLPRIISSEKEQSLIIEKIRHIQPLIHTDKKIIVVNPNASQLLPLRRWPISSYIELVDKILKRLDAFVVIIGLAADKKDAETIVHAINDTRCINMAGQTNLMELIHLFNIADVLISNDSGPPNFAALTPIHTIVFFGPETPVLYRPLGDNVKVFHAPLSCSPCVSAYNHRQSPCRDNKCLQSISPDSVFDHLNRYLTSP
jgi:ADP-heptose:LPS heptosyltransferase